MIASAVLDGVKGQLPSPPHTPHFATTPSSVRSFRSNARGNLRALKGLKKQFEGPRRRQGICAEEQRKIEIVAHLASLIFDCLRPLWFDTELILLHSRILNTEKITLLKTLNGRDKTFEIN